MEIKTIKSKYSKMIISINKQIENNTNYEKDIILKTKRNAYKLFIKDLNNFL